MHIFLFRAERLKSRSRGGQGAEEARGREFPNLSSTSSFPVTSPAV